MKNLQIGDRVRVLWVEEMLELNGELKEDKYGEWVQFYDEHDNEIYDSMFPIEDNFLELQGKLFTIDDFSKDGKINLLEDNNIGYAVTKEMIRKVGA